MELRTEALAKLNLCLYVGKREVNGYHNLISLFQKTDKFKDQIFFSYDDEVNESSISVSGLQECCRNEESTVYKACEIWLKETKHKAKIVIDIIKGIPCKSGLGGSSSDAGSVLLLLERASGNHTSINKLVKIAKSVGSDVPFFVYDCNAAVVSGQGEIVCPIEERNDLDFDIFFSPQQKKSTSDAYRLLDQRDTAKILPKLSDIVYEYRENPLYWGFENDFEVLYEKPVKKAFLSGSGNAWFTVKIK